MSTTVAEYARRLQELDEQARTLRAEVDRLHITRHTLELTDATAQTAKEVRARSEEAEREASTNRKSLRSTTSTSRTTRDAPRLPTEFLNELQEKVGETRLRMREHKELEREKADLLAAVERVEGCNQEAEQKYLRLMEVAGVGEVGGRSSHAQDIGKLSEHESAVKSITALYRKRGVLQELLRRQTAELERLTQLLEEMTQAQEQKEDAVRTLRETQERLRETRAERQNIARLVETKDQLLAKNQKGPTEDVRVRDATMDRRVAMLELQRERELVRQNDLAIRNRALQVAKLEKRLEVIGDAVAGDDLNDVERVDVEVVDTLMREIETLYRLHDEANVRLGFLDAQVEKQDYKIDTLKRMIASTRKEMSRIEEDHQRYIHSIHKELRQDERLNELDVRSVEQEIAQIRSASEALRSRSRSNQVTRATRDRSVQAMDSQL